MFRREHCGQCPILFACVEHESSDPTEFEYCTLAMLSRLDPFWISTVSLAVEQTNTKKKKPMRRTRDTRRQKTWIQINLCTFRMAQKIMHLYAIEEQADRKSAAVCGAQAIIQYDHKTTFRRDWPIMILSSTSISQRCRCQVSSRGDSKLEGAHDCVKRTHMRVYHFWSPDSVWWPSRTSK